jgi:hypothetical protein
MHRHGPVFVRGIALNIDQVLDLFAFVDAVPSTVTLRSRAAGELLAGAPCQPRRPDG